MREDDELPELDGEERALIDKLRDLPPEGEEPDWQKLEAAIRAEVGDAAPRPWWRNWRWIVPVWLLATTAVVALLVMRRPEPHVTTATRHDAGVFTPSQAPAPAAEPAAVNAMWLDGQAIELDDVSGAALDELDGAARAALRPDDESSGGILPATDYGWIDSLDDDSVARVDEWLKRKRS